MLRSWIHDQAAAKLEAELLLSGLLVVTPPACGETLDTLFEAGQDPLFQVAGVRKEQEGDVQN